MQKRTKMSLVLAVAFGLSAGFSSAGGIPAFDGANVTQTTITALENVAQTMKQINQYKTQLEQYERQLKDAKNLSNFNWGNVEDTISKMQSSMDTLAAQKKDLGSLDRYINNFESTYKNSPCFVSSSKCTAADRAQMVKNQEDLQRYKKLANDGVLRGVNSQIDSISKDAAQLKALQRSAEGSEGQMQSLQYANQISSAQASQLLQLRNMMNQQMQADAVTNQARIDDENRAHARSQQVFGLPKDRKAK